MMMGGTWRSVPDLLFDSYASGELQRSFPTTRKEFSGRNTLPTSLGKRNGKLCPSNVLCLKSSLGDTFTVASASLTHLPNGDDKMCIACKQYHFKKSEPIMRQPQPKKSHHEYMKVSLDWSTNLFGCMDDEHTCLLGALCGPCLACSLARQLGESWFVVTCVPGGVTAMRTKLRMQQNIEGSICDDCLKLSFCCPFALCQMARELDNAEIGRVG